MKNLFFKKKKRNSSAMLHTEENENFPQGITLLYWNGD